MLVWTKKKLLFIFQINLFPNMYILCVCDHLQPWSRFLFTFHAYLGNPFNISFNMYFIHVRGIWICFQLN